MRSRRRGPFVLETRVGAGGMGEVWRARHIDHGAVVAVKGLLRATPKTLASFEQEVRAIAALDHPHVLPVYDAGVVVEGPWLAMRWVAGGSVDRLLESWDAVRILAVQLLDALAHVHARGILHRDLKPANVLVDTDPIDGTTRYRLADFGMASAGGVSALDGGTLRYLPLEQLLGEPRDQGPWTDLFALGCVVWEQLCGAPPWRSGDPTGLAHELRAGVVPVFAPRVPVPHGAEAWLRRLLAVSVPDRFQRAADAAHALAGLRPPDVEGEAVSAPLDIGCATLGATLLGIDAGGVTPPRSHAGVVVSAPPVPEDWRPVWDLAPAAPMSGTGLGTIALREPVLVGRWAERDALWGALRDVGRTAGVELRALIGPPGSGRGRLLRWLGRRAEELGAARWLHGRTLREVVDGVFATAGLEGQALAEQLEVRLAWLGDDTPSGMAAAAALVDERVALPARVSALSRILGALRATRAVLVTVEHPEPGLMAALGRLSGTATHGLLVVAAAEATLDWPSIELPPVDGPALHWLARFLLPMAPGLRARLVDEADGRPGALVRQVRALAASGELVAGHDGYHAATVTADPELPLVEAGLALLADGEPLAASERFRDAVGAAASQGDLPMVARITDTWARGMERVGVPEAHEAWGRLARARLVMAFALGHERDALREADRLLEGGATWGWTDGSFAGTLAAVVVGAGPRADAYLERAEALAGDHPERRGRVLAARARMLWRSDDAAGSEALFREAISLFERAGSDSGLGEAWLGLARVALRRGRPAEAVPLLERARHHYDRHGDPRLQTAPALILGDALTELGHHAEAERAFDAVERVTRVVGNPAFMADVQLMRGNLYQEMGRMLEAEACYRRCLSLDPGHSTAPLALGQLLALQGRFASGAATIAPLLDASRAVERIAAHLVTLTVVDDPEHFSRLVHRLETDAAGFAEADFRPFVALVVPRAPTADLAGRLQALLPDAG